MNPSELAAEYKAAIKEWREHGPGPDTEERILLAENNICDHLNIGLDHTEQGLDEYATTKVAEFVEAQL